MTCEPVGLREIAQRLGVTLNTAKAWRVRGELPAPRWRAGGADLWNWPTINNWATKRKANRD